MRSWHDFEIAGYMVDGARSEITFQMAWPDEKKPEPIQGRLRFVGVECYYLEHDLGRNIVYSWSERDIPSFLEEWTQRFEAECKFGWPKFWRTRPYPAQPIATVYQEAHDFLAARRAKCYELSSSYGLSGWVLANGELEEETHA